MFVLGLFDVAQCVPHFITGLFTIYQSTWFPYFAKVLGVIATPCYVGYTVMTLILAVNRFFQFAAFRVTRNIFSPKNVKVGKEFINSSLFTRQLLLGLG